MAAVTTNKNDSYNVTYKKLYYGILVTLHQKMCTMYTVCILSIPIRALMLLIAICLKYLTLRGC